MALFQHKFIPSRPALEAAQSAYDAIKSVGGYNPATNTFQPLKLRAEIYEGDILRSHIFTTVAAALEAGILDEEKWPSQLFADEDSFNSFVNELAEFEDCYKLQESWWQALRALSFGGDLEEGYCSGRELAERLTEALNDLPVQWA